MNCIICNKVKTTNAITLCWMFNKCGSCYHHKDQETIPEWEDTSAVRLHTMPIDNYLDKGMYFAIKELDK